MYKKGNSSQTFTLEDPEYYDLHKSNLEHRERFARMARMGMMNTRFASKEVIALGIYGNVPTLFTMLGWQHVMYSEWKNYGRVTLEFLSTVEVFENETRYPFLKFMSFCLDNEDRQLSIEKVTDIYHVLHGGLTRDSSKY